jgi:hypothetical protein
MSDTDDGAERFKTPTLDVIVNAMTEPDPGELATGLASGTAPSTVTGAGAGLCLLAFGLATLLTGGRFASATGEPFNETQVASPLPG